MRLRSVVVILAALMLAVPSAAEKKRKGKRRAPVPAAAAAPAPQPPTDNQPSDGDDVPPPADSAVRPPALAGEYQGVRPGKVPLPPHPPKPGGPPQLTWSGFMLTESGSRVFLQLTQEVPYTVAHSAREIVVTLKGCRIHRRNNARPVSTRFFATPVAKVQARRHGQDTRVVIGLRQPVQTQPRVEAGEGGYQFLMLDFPRAEEPAPASQPLEP